MADPFDVDEDDEIISVAAQVLKSASDATADARSIKKPSEVSATPESRGTLLPIMIPKGGFQSEEGTVDRFLERSAVPGVLHGPYKAFEKLYDLMAKGASTSDPDVIDLSAEVATGVLGGTVFKNASREALALARGGKPAARTGRAAERSADEFDPSYGPDWGPELKNQFGTAKPGEPIIGLNKNEMAMELSLYAEVVSPKIGRELDEIVGFIKSGESTVEEWMKHPETSQEIKDVLGGFMQALKGGGFEEEAAVAITKGGRSPIHGDFLVGGPKAGQPHMYHSDTGEWIVAGPGADGVWTSVPFTDEKKASTFLSMLKDAAGDKATYPAKGTLHLPGQQSQTLEDWLNSPYKAPPEYGLFNPKPYKLGDAPGASWEAAQKELIGNLPWAYHIEVNGKKAQWNHFANSNKDAPELLDAIKLAYEGGVGTVMWGGGAEPQTIIKLPPKKGPKIHSPSTKPNDIPTELEMRNWPDAKRIDNISVDEAHPGPIIGYHGTTSDFITFDLSKSRDIGVHFGTQEQAGNRGGSETGTRIIPALIDIKNPITLPDLGGWGVEQMLAAISKTVEETLGPGKTVTMENRIDDLYKKYKAGKTSTKGYEVIRQELGKLGYDGIRYLNSVEGEGWSYIVWKKDTVKSATNPDHILYMKGPGPGLPSREDDKMAEPLEDDGGDGGTPGGGGAPDPYIDKWKRMLEGQGSLPAAPPAVGTPSVPGTPSTPEAPVTPGPLDGLPTPEELSRMSFGEIRERSKGLGREMGVPQDYTEVVPFLEKQWDAAQKPKNMRGILRGAGAAVGGMAGVPFGGAPGVMAGTAFGSAVGGYMANVYDSLYDARSPEDKPGTMEKLLEPLKGALVDASVTGGAQVALPMVVGGSKRLLSQLLRLPPNSKELLKEASDIGVEIGVANVVQSGPGHVVVNAMGRIPLIGGSAQNAAKLQAKQLVAAHNDLFGQVANPRAASEVSEAAYNEGTKRFTEFAVKVQQRFEHASRVGQEAGNIIPAGRIKDAAQAAIDKLEALPGGMKVWLPHSEQKFLTALTKYPEKVSTNDIKAVDVFLENAMRRADSKTNLSMPMIAEIRTAASKALGSVDHPAAKLMTAADVQFKEGMRTFGTDTAKTVGKLERNIYATGQVLPGKNTPDEMMEVMSSLTTPSKVAEMRRLVGDDIIKQSARVRLDQAWQSAVASKEGEAFKWSADKFNKSLGLDQPNSSKFETFREMLRGTGVHVDEVQKLARVAESVSNAPIADVSTFMARATMLRGAGGLTAALKGALTAGLATGGAATAGMPTALVGIVLARQGVGAFMKPSLLRAATTAMDSNAGTQAKVSALYHLFDEGSHLFESLFEDN